MTIINEIRKAQIKLKKLENRGAKLDDSIRDRLKNMLELGQLEVIQYGNDLRLAVSSGVTLCPISKKILINNK